MSTIPELLAKHVGPHKRLVATCDLADLNWSDAAHDESAWTQFYQRVCDAFPAVEFKQAYSLVYCGRAVMRVLLDHQRRYLRAENGRGPTRDEINSAVAWSNMNSGPMEGKWIPKDTIIVTVEA